MEGQGHGLPREQGEQIPEKMNFKKIVEIQEKDEESSQEIVVDWNAEGSFKQQLVRWNRINRAGKAIHYGDLLLLLLPLRKTQYKKKLSVEGLEAFKALMRFPEDGGRWSVVGMLFMEPFFMCASDSWELQYY